ncbi:MAG: trigger factor [Bacteroidetes bacterium]|nr:MAG: trigger factor [Bacteroidota bacterium]
MNITKEQIDELNAVVKVKLGPEDYQDRVDKSIKDYQKRVQMPGFRPGKVPVGMVKKMYGKSILAEELNKLLSDTLYKYINEEKLEVLGNPLPKESQSELNLDTTEFEFEYDLALAPQFSLELSPSIKYTENKIRIDDKMIDNYVNDLGRRYGNIAQGESVEEGDLLYGDFVELDEAGNIKPGGIYKSSTLFLDKPAKDFQQQIIGAKPEDKFVLEPNQVSDSPEDLAQKLGITKEEAMDLKAKLQFTIKNISRLHPAEITQELFDKVYGPGVVNNVEEFRGRIAAELEKMFVRDTEQRLHSEIVNDLISRANLALPDSFLKRWLMAVNKEPLTEEQVEAEYPMYARQLRWQLIENKLIKENGLNVSQQEVEEHVKELLRQNYKKYYPEKEPEDGELTLSAQNILKKEDEAKKIVENLYHEKLMMLYRMKCSIETKEVSYEEFAGK